MVHNPIIGRGWRFPPTLDERATVALVSDEAEIEEAIQIILGTAPGQRVMRACWKLTPHRAPQMSKPHSIPRHHRPLTELTCARSTYDTEHY